MTLRLWGDRILRERTYRMIARERTLRERDFIEALPSSWWFNRSGMENFGPWTQIKPGLRTVPVVNAVMRTRTFKRFSFPWVSISAQDPVTWGRPFRIFFHSRPWENQEQAEAMSLCHTCPWVFVHALRFRCDSYYVRAQGPYIDTANLMKGVGTYLACFGREVALLNVSLAEKFFFSTFTLHDRLPDEVPFREIHVSMMEAMEKNATDFEWELKDAV